MDDATPSSGVFSSLSGAARDVVQARDVYGGVHFHASASPAWPSALRQLPTETASFTGRECELAQLIGQIDRALARERPGAVVISAINGMAGVGKTALAVHAAHRVAQWFPDGQLFVDLHGYTPGLPPREPGDVLGLILQCFGLRPQEIPAALEARTALYRDRLADTRTLILLDNAATAAQVAPLLPGSGRCLALITSRQRLKTLDDTYALPLDVLPHPDAVRLLREVAGPERLDEGDRAASDLAALCGYLPLALRIIAALIRHRPAWSLTYVAARLRDRPEVIALTDGDSSVKAAFDLSYDTVAAEQQTAFRRLGMLPGHDCDAYAAAALLDADMDYTERLLQDLVDHHLLGEPAAGRYRMHDLLRTYARGRAEREDSPTEREDALDRVLDYYQDTAARIKHHNQRYVPAAARTPQCRPALETIGQVRAWVSDELPNLTAAASYSATRAHPTHVAALSAALHGHLLAYGPWSSAASLHTLAVDVARALGDRRAEAAALRDLGSIQHETGDWSDATKNYTAALDLFQELDDAQAPAHALRTLSMLKQLSGDFAGADEAAQQALEAYRAVDDQAGIAEALAQSAALQADVNDHSVLERYKEALGRFRVLEDRRGEAWTLVRVGVWHRYRSSLTHAATALDQAYAIVEALGDQRIRTACLMEYGTIRYLTGDYPAAIRSYEQALDLAGSIGSRPEQAVILGNLGLVRWEIGDYTGAAASMSRALDLSVAMGWRRNQASVTNNLGLVQRETGDLVAAIQAHQQALDIFTTLGQRYGQAHALNNLAAARRRQGDYATAGQAARQAVETFQSIGDRDGEAKALNGRAQILIDTGDLQAAHSDRERALRIARDIGAAHSEASALEGLGEILLQEGDLIGARQYMRSALKIYQRLRVPGASRVEQRLASLG